MLGLRIKWLRAEKQMTQEDLSEKAGLFRTYMSRVEAGQANPSLTMLHQIARALDIPLGQLFDQVPSEPPPRVQSTNRPSRGRAAR